MTIAVDLLSSVTYTAGEELAFRMTTTVPETGNYYVLGGLYDSNFNFIPGTLFGVLLPSGEIYASNSQGQMTTWALLEGETEEIECKFVLDRTNVLVGLFLMKMAGEEASLDDDEQISSTTIALVGAEEAVTIEVTSALGAVVVVGMMAMMIKTLG